ncbi:MAG: type-F conjugative transfer system secretin TraK [Sulfuritalea sp.]|nr:type-F conjugative transfer system secretin TraK [Sulfuritalea sp.]
MKAYWAALLAMGVSCTVLAADVPVPGMPPQLDSKVLGKKRPVITMPVLGAPGQPQAPVKQNIVRISEGENEIVYVGLGFPNRIATPFANPQPVAAEGLVEFSVVGRNIFFIPDKEAPIGLFITDASGQGSVASLTLIPRAGMPGQNILLVAEGDTAARTSADISKREMTAPASDYVDGLKQLLRVFVQGGVAPGYQEGALKVGAARVGAVVLMPEKIFTGSTFNVYRYRVENAGRESIELNEASFNEEGVRAVAFWPNARLAPTESTNVFIVAEPAVDK